MIIDEGVTLSYFNLDKATWQAISRFPASRDGRERALALYEQMLTGQVGLSGKLTVTTQLRVVEWRRRRVNTVQTDIDYGLAQANTKLVTAGHVAKYRDRHLRLVRDKHQVLTSRVLRGPETVEERSGMRIYI